MYIVVMNIMEKPVSDIFSTCVFSNIMEVTFIFPPRVFLQLRAGNGVTDLVSDR